MLRSQKIRPDPGRKIKPDPQILIKPQIPRTDEPPMAIENGKIICNLEFACILSSLSQKTINAVFIIQLLVYRFALLQVYRL